MKFKDISDINSFKNWNKTDAHLSDLKQSPFFWNWPCFMPLKEQITKNWNSGGIHIIRGPRQVGKSTLLKTILSSLWESQLSPHPHSLILQGDWIENYKELDLLIGKTLDTRKDIKLVLIDEVTFIRDWQRALKGWLDAGIGRKIHFILTGSNSFDLMKQAELLPGRRGKGLDYELLPMNFSEFSSATLSSPWGNQSSKEKFFQYLNCGGFPNAVREFIQHGTTEEAENTYLSWIRGDFLKAGKDDKLLRELLAAVCLTIMTPVGFDDLQKQSSMGSHNTVQEYLHFCECAYILREFRRIDPSKWSLSARKNKKYYFLDPLILKIIRNWTAIPIPEDRYFAAQCESFVALWAYSHSKRVGYFRNKEDHEIDFLSPEFAIEVKSGEKIELKNLLKINQKKKYFLSLNPEKKIHSDPKNGDVVCKPIWDIDE